MTSAVDHVCWSLDFSIFKTQSALRSYRSFKGENSNMAAAKGCAVAWKILIRAFGTCEDVMLYCGTWILCSDARWIPTALLKHEYVHKRSAPMCPALTMCLLSAALFMWNQTGAPVDHWAVHTERALSTPLGFWRRYVTGTVFVKSVTVPRTLLKDDLGLKHCREMLVMFGSPYDTSHKHNAAVAQSLPRGVGSPKTDKKQGHLFRVDWVSMQIPAVYITAQLLSSGTVEDVAPRPVCCICCCITVKSQCVLPC